MIIGIGLDIADQTRIQQSIDRYGEQFLQRIFTAQEILLCQRYRSYAERYAGKFAAKEAFMKAIGTGLSQQITFQHIEILNYPSGAPYIITRDKAAEISKHLGVTHTHISLSHTANIAVAVVILEQI